MALTKKIRRSLILAAFGVALATPGIAVAQDTGATVNGLTGNAAAGKEYYRRWCVGCHGKEGNGEGENAPYVDPRPRDFTDALFRRRSTPTGTLPTDQDLYDTIIRRVTDKLMATWSPLTPQTRVDLIAYIKSFSPKWQTQKAASPISTPPDPPQTIDSVPHGRQLFDQM